MKEGKRGRSVKKDQDTEIPNIKERGDWCGDENITRKWNKRDEKWKEWKWKTNLFLGLRVWKYKREERPQCCSLYTWEGQRMLAPAHKLWISVNLCATDWLFAFFPQSSESQHLACLCWYFKTIRNKRGYTFLQSGRDYYSPSVYICTDWIWHCFTETWQAYEFYWYVVYFRGILKMCRMI